MDFYTSDLRWDDVAPEKRRFDESRARDIVESFLSGDEFTSCLETGESIQDYYFVEGCIDQLLVQEFGVWVGGWRSGVNGGPVTSEFDPEDASQKQVDSVILALRQWLEFLQEVDQLLLDVPMSGSEISSVCVEKAAARLPSDKIVQRATRVVSEALARTEPLPAEDSLEHWLSIRELPSAQWEHFSACRIPVLRKDGHRHFIETREKDKRMLHALERSRLWAEGETPLTIQVLKDWQAIVLSDSALQIRSTDAYAKDGRERYGVRQLSRLGEFLDEANDHKLTPQWRAALAYLDICFFHPFEDGNARLARLAMDAILWRAGYALNYVEPVFVISRTANDREGGTYLAIAVDSALGRR